MNEQRVAWQRAARVHACVGVALALLIGASAGCVYHARPGEPRVERRAPARLEPIHDDLITRVIRSEIARDGSAAAARIRVSTRDGVVVLGGQVDTLLARARVERLAQTVKGVRRVRNRITVAPLEEPGDGALRRMVAGALSLDAALAGMPVQVEVDEGQVILHGTVPSPADRWLVERVVMGVRGVAALDNRVVVRDLADVPSQQLQRHVEHRLRHDALVRDGLIRVQVHGDQVVLHGVVRSAAERTRAYEIAWVPGVRSVDVSALHVDWWAPEDAVVRELRARRPDAELRRAVRDALSLDPRAPSTPIRVDVSRGVVTLRGDVDHLGARVAAERAVRSLVGVVQVENQLTVRPPQGTSDQELTRRARVALRLNAVTARHPIEVTVRRGAVRLAGSVGSFYEKATAEDVILRLSGVRGLANRLEVANERVPHVHNPHLGPYEPLTTRLAFVPAEPQATDAEIFERIVEAMVWNPFVDERRIVVKVEEGRATLAGTAESAQERRAAIRSALSGGAVAVASNIRIR